MSSNLNNIPVAPNGFAPNPPAPPKPAVVEGGAAPKDPPPNEDWAGWEPNNPPV